MLSPDIKIVLTFTGQGSISELDLWKGKFGESPAAKRIFDMTDDIVGFPLSKLVAEGPLDKLIETKYAQPTLVTFELAALAVVKEHDPQLLETYPLVACLGHSAGEIAALAVAGVYGVRTGVALSWQRGSIMQVHGGRGKMAAILADKENVRELCEGTTAEPVNFNNRRQTVISGEAGQVDEVINKARGKFNVVPVNVPFAFHHSVLMRQAQEKFKEVLIGVEFKDPEVPVVPNVTGEPCLSGAKIKEILAHQIASPVEWQKSISSLLEKGVTFIEFSPHPVLTKILRGIDKDARGIWVGDMASALNLRQALLA